MILIPKKQQSLGDSIPPFTEDEANTKDDNYRTVKSANELAQQIMKIGSLRIRRICVDSQNTLMNTIVLSFDDDHLNQKLVSRSFPVADFNSSVNLDSHHQLIFPLQYKSITAHSSDDKELVKEIIFVFKSNEVLSNVRLVRDVIRSLKTSSATTADKLKFVHEFCTAVWFMFKHLKYYWENLDEIVMAERANEKIGFLPLRSYPYSWKLEPAQQMDNDYYYQLPLNYSEYFKALLESLFEIVSEDLILNPLKEKIKTNHPPTKKRIIELCKTLSQTNLSSELLETVPSTLLDIYLQELSLSKEPKTKKKQKFEAKQAKREKILECLNKYTFLYVLDITKMSERELQELKKRLRMTGQGECHFYPQQLFVKEILPHLNQFKDLREQHMKNTELSEAFKRDRTQVSFLFTNDNLVDTHLLIDSIVTKRNLPAVFETRVVEGITFPAEKIVMAYSQYLWQHLENLELPAKIVNGKIYAQKDLTIKKGTCLNQSQAAILFEIQKTYSENKTPYRRKITILHIFENGYLVPKSIIKMFENKEEVVEKAMKKSFDWIRAIQAETDLKILDLVDILKAQNIFADLLRKVFGVYWNLHSKPPRKLSHVKVTFLKGYHSSKEIDPELTDLFDDDEPLMIRKQDRETINTKFVGKFGDY